MGQATAQLEHGSLIVKVGVEANTYTSIPAYIEGNPQTGGPFVTMPQEPWNPGKGGNPDRIIQLHWGKVRIHASYKSNQNMGELQQLRNKSDSPSRWTVINS